MPESATIESLVQAAQRMNATMAGAHLAYGLVVRTKSGKLTLFDSEGAAHVGEICGMFFD
jgi:hypothetical protein